MYKFNTMKNRMLLIFLMAVSFYASAQSNEKKVKITTKSELEYTVANDGKTKDGLYYIKNLANNALWLQGHYKNNMRSGTWYFFNSKAQLTMRYNYDQQKLLFIDTSSLHNIAVHVLSEDAAIAKNASAPLPLCPIDYYVSLIGNQIYTSYYDPANENLTAEVTAHIDTEGKAVYTLAYLNNDKKTAEKVVDLNVAFPIEWIPSKYGDKAIPSEFTIYANIKSNSTVKDDFRRFRWDN